MKRRRRSILTMVAIVAYVAFAGASASVVRAGAMAGVVLLARESGRAGRAAAALGVGRGDPARRRSGAHPRRGLPALRTGHGRSHRVGHAAHGLDRSGRPGAPPRLARGEPRGVAGRSGATLPIVLLRSVGSPSCRRWSTSRRAARRAGDGRRAGRDGSAASWCSWAHRRWSGASSRLPAGSSLRIMVAIVDAMASLPFASVTLPGPIAAVTAVATLRGHRPRARPMAGPPRRARGCRGTTAPRADTTSGAILRAVVVPPAEARGPDPRHHVVVTGAVIVSRPAGVARVSVLDVGQGDAILVEGSRGGRLLIDGGPDPGRLLVVLDQRIPPWDRRIDAVILTHPHEDHVAGLARLLDRYQVRRVFEPGMRGPGPGYAAWLSRLASTGSPTRLGLAAGDRLAVDDIDLRVLWPIARRGPVKPPDGGTGINNVSIVLLGRRRRRPIPAGGRRRGGDRRIAAGGSTAATRPAQGRPSRQPHGDDPGVRRCGTTADRDRVGRHREPVRTPHACDARAPVRGRCPGLPHRSRRDGRRHVHVDRALGPRRRRSSVPVGLGPVGRRRSISGGSTVARVPVRDPR